MYAKKKESQPNIEPSQLTQQTNYWTKPIDSTNQLLNQANWFDEPTIEPSQLIRRTKYSTKPSIVLNQVLNQAN